MGLKRGTSHDIIQANIRDMVSAGHEPKKAVATALAMKRKSQMMAQGGMVDADDDEGLGTNNSEDAQRSLAEIQMQGRSKPQEVMNPEMQMEENHLAKALYNEAQQEESLHFAEGGLVVGEDDGLNGSEPSMDMVSATDEPMSDEPQKPAAPEHTMSGLTEAAKMAIEAKKKKRRFS